MGLQQSTTETANPPSEVSLYLEFISLAVSAIAVTVVSKSTRAVNRNLIAGDHEPGPRLDGAEGASLDARHLHESGDRVAGHAQVMFRAPIQRAFATTRLGMSWAWATQCRAHGRGNADLRLAAAFGGGQRRVVFAQITDRRRGQQAIRGSFLSADLGRLRPAHRPGPA